MVTQLAMDSIVNHGFQRRPFVGELWRRKPAAAASKMRAYLQLYWLHNIFAVHDFVQLFEASLGLPFRFLYGVQGLAITQVLQCLLQQLENQILSLGLS